MEETDNLKDDKIKDDNAKKFEFGGTLCAIIIIFIPLQTLIYNIFCSNQSCLLTKLPDLTRYTKLESWFTTRAFILIISYAFLQSIISTIPYFGKKVTLVARKKTYATNGIFSMITTTCIGIAIEKFYYPISEIIYNDYIQMSIVASIFGVLLALFLYIKGSRATEEDRNPYGSTGNNIYDFISGREINPMLFGFINIKLILYRFGYIGMLLINSTWLYYYVSIKNVSIININLTLLLFCGMQIIFVLDTLNNEWIQVSTFEFLYDGCGFLFSFGYSFYPFYSTLITKRILEHDITLPNEVLIGTLVFFLIGLYIFHTSNVEKNTFRKNPKNLQVANLTSIPTLQGKSLLNSGWWGFVRHPNYLGDLMMRAAWGVGCYNSIPIYTTFSTFIFLMHRAKRDADRCSQRYEEAWKSYCQEVPYHILPLVY